MTECLALGGRRTLFDWSSRISLNCAADPAVRKAPRRRRRQVLDKHPSDIPFPCKYRHHGKPTFSHTRQHSLRLELYVPKYAVVSLLVCAAARLKELGLMI